jgi:hypothetical protein
MPIILHISQLLKTELSTAVLRTRIFRTFQCSDWIQYMFTFLFNFFCFKCSMAKNGATLIQTYSIILCVNRISVFLVSAVKLTKMLKDVYALQIRFFSLLWMPFRWEVWGVNEKVWHLDFPPVFLHKLNKLISTIFHFKPFTVIRIWLKDTTQKKQYECQIPCMHMQ